MCSTIRLNRAGWPKELGSAVTKKLKPGDVLFQQDGNMVATLWKDKRPVAILSTNAEAAMGKQERKASGGEREVPVPEPVLVYNSSMGGVDLADQYAAYYSTGRPSIRWWRYLCWWLLQTAMVNAFILWRDSQTKEPASSKRRVRHIDFRLAVLRALCAGKVSRKHAAPQAPSQAGVTDSKPLSHRSVRLPGRKKICQQCKRKGVRTAKGHGVETVFGCPICLVHLCPALCFAEFSPGPGTVSVKCVWTGSISCFEHLKDKDSILVLLVFIGRTAAVLFVMFKCVDHRGLHNQAQE